MLSLQNKFSEKVEIIAPSRQMVRDLPVTLVVDNKEKDRRHLYLFTDVLILAKVGKSANDKYQLIAYISLDTLLVTPGTDKLPYFQGLSNSAHPHLFYRS